MTPKEHWDNEWQKRIKDENSTVSRNVEKAGKIIYELCKRPGYIKLEKIDVGCGPPTHAIHLSDLYGGWDKTYTGIDLSEIAVQYGRDCGLNVIQGDFLEYQTEKKYDVFMFLDSLEHIFDHEKLSQKIKELAAPGYYIIGNVPFYPNAHNKDPGLERDMDIKILKNFMWNSGVKIFNIDVYGALGYPYCFFEGMNV